MMKLQDGILKAMAKKITWMEAAEIAGVTDRTMRRIKQRYQEFGYNGLFDQRPESEACIGCRWRQPRKCWRLHPTSCRRPSPSSGKGRGR
jgi:Homeodomain-like domain